MKYSVFIFLLCVAIPLHIQAETLVAARTLRNNSVIIADDLLMKEGETPGALSGPEDAIGKETRVVIYAGRPIRPQDIGPVTIIKRNQIVPLVFRRGGLRIITDARALTNGGAGDLVRVMNLSSRTTVSGLVTSDGSVLVGH